MRRRWGGMSSAAGVVFATLLALACEEVPQTSDASGPSGEARREKETFDAKAAAALGRGFLVWESDRSGAWRIWARELDGSGLRQLAPDEPGRQHCCAQIAPDGERIAYLSFAGPGRAYPDETDTGAVHLIGRDGSDPRRLVEAARTAHESRAVVWVSDAELVYLTADGRTARLDVDSGAEEVLVAEPAEAFGWLLDPTLAHATLGLPSFSPYDAAARRVITRPTIAGCQAFFTQDGRWGYWTAGAGGPIHRIDLATREVTRWLAKNDPRLPDGRGYLYFPMTSDDGRLLALAASAGRHDHFTADYELFVLETDPRTLEPRGDAVRFTFDPAVDRFPDVWAEPLVLGDHAGEAPFTVRLSAGPEADWAWELGDGATATGGSAEHLYAEPGLYEVRARRGETVVSGRVRVASAAPPRVVRNEWTEGSRRLVVWFDEPVGAERVEAKFDSGRPVAAVAVGPEGRSIRVDLEAPLERADRLVLAGVVDRAQPPNASPPIPIDVQPPLWPSREDDLALLWQSGDAANFFRDRAAAVDLAPTLRAEGRATLDGRYALDLAGGTFAADSGAADLLLGALRATHELTLELQLTPERGADGRILTIGDSRPAELRLFQKDGSLWVALRARRNRTRTWSPAVELFPLEPGRAVHLALTYRPGLLRAWRDGEPVLVSEAIQGDFFHWKSGTLVFGGDWHGQLQDLALYDRALAPAEVEESAARHERLTAGRPVAERVVVEATRVASATPPRLAEISPYREALVVGEYRVESVVSGRVESETVFVAEWAILGGVELPEPPRSATLTLERFADNPQLEGVVLGRTEGRHDGVELWYAVP